MRHALGHKVEPDPKAYKRRDKHTKPLEDGEPEEGEYAMGLMFDWDRMSARIRAESICHDFEDLLLEIASGLDRRELAEAIEAALKLPSNPHNFRSEYCTRLGYDPGPA